MPTTKTRIQVPASPETLAAIDAYGAVLGLSRAAVCAQLLEQATPGLVELTKALEKVHESPARALREVSEAVYKLTEQADQISMQLEPKAKKRKA